MPTPAPYALPWEHGDPGAAPGVMDPRRHATDNMSAPALFGWGLGHSLDDARRAWGQRLSIIPQSQIDKSAYDDAAYLQHPAAQWGSGIGSAGIGAGEWMLGRLGLKKFANDLKVHPQLSAAYDKLPTVAKGPLGAVSDRLTGKVAAPILGGAAMGEAGALQTPHTSGEDDTSNQLFSTGVGAAAHLPAQAIRRLISPSVATAGRKAIEAPIPSSGISPEDAAWATRGQQITGDFLPPYAYTPEGKTTTEQLTGMLPGATGRATVAQAARQKYTNAVGKLFGAPTDAQGNVDLVTAVPQRTNEVGQQIGALRDQYGVTAKLNLGATKKAINAVAADPRAQAGDAGVPQVRAIERQLQGHFSDLTGANGAIDGQMYTVKRAGLYDLMDRSQKNDFQPGYDAAKTMLGTLDDGFNRTLAASATPEEQAAVGTLNKQYSLLRTLRAGKGQEIYDPQTGTIAPSTLYDEATKRGETWLTGQRTTPSGNPDPRVDVTNLGVSRGYRNIAPDLDATSGSGGHGMLNTIMSTGAAGLAPGVATYELMPHEREEDMPYALGAAGAASLGGMGLGRTAGRFMRSPVATEGLARHYLGPTGAMIPEWGSTISAYGGPYAIAPVKHNAEVAANNGPVPAPQQKAEPPAVQWELVDPAEGTSSHP